MRFTSKAMVSLALMGALVSPVFAQAEREIPADAVRLSLSEALTRSLEQNLDLSIFKLDPQIAYEDVLFQKAAFDPLFTASASHTEQNSEPSQVFVGSESKQDRLFAGLSGLLKFGAQYGVGLESNRLDSNSSFNTYNPSYNSGLALDFRMPFLRGLGVEATTAALVIAERNLEVSHDTLRGQATSTLRAVEDAYWNLRAAREAQRVSDQTLKLSQDLYELNKKKVEVGTLAPIEITQAEANVASNVELTIRSKEAVGNSEDNLRRLMAIPKDDPMWTHMVVPTEEPVDEPRTVVLEEAIATAMTARPEMIEARAALENAQLAEKAAKNTARHQLDLNVGLTPSGNNLIDILPGPDTIPGTADDVIDTGGIGESYSEITSFDNYLWTVGLTYSVPIGNRANKANYAVATINREKAELFLQNMEDLVRVDIRTTARAVETGYERVAAARKNVELQTKKLDAEQKKFDNGMSTSFEVFTFQTDLRNAQLSLIQGLLDYNKSLADLERAKGTLLESKGLKLAADAGR